MADCRLEIRLKPRAKFDRIAISDNGTLSIAVTAPPLEGKANDHLMKLLADRLSVPKSSLSIIKGGHSKNKVVALTGLTKEDALQRIGT